MKIFSKAFFILSCLVSTSAFAQSKIDISQAEALINSCSEVICPRPTWVAVGTLNQALPMVDMNQCDVRIHNRNIAGGGHYLLPVSHYTNSSYQVFKFALDLQDQSFATFIDNTAFRNQITSYRNQNTSPKDLNLEIRLGQYRSVTYSVDYADAQGLIQGTGMSVLNQTVLQYLTLEKRCF